MWHHFSLIPFPNNAIFGLEDVLFCVATSTKLERSNLYVLVLYSSADPRDPSVSSKSELWA